MAHASGRAISHATGRLALSVGVLCLLAVVAAAEDLPRAPDAMPARAAAAGIRTLDFTSAPDVSGRVFVAERTGRVRILNRDGSVNEAPFLDLSSIDLPGAEADGGEHVLYSIAFDPDFSKNGYVFAYRAPKASDGEGMIIRFTADPENPDAISAERARETAKVVMRLDRSYSRYGGSIGFGPDGSLHVVHPLGRRRLPEPHSD